MSRKASIHHPPGARFQSGNRVYKVVMLGQGGVGKSALTLQFVMHTFQEDHDPTIEDAYQKQTQIDNLTCVLDVLDTAGQDEFTAMREQYIRGGEGFILMYSVIERRSFKEMRRFRDTVNRVRNYDQVPIVLVGNKCDLEKRREVSKEEGEDLGKELNCPFFETSAALRLNVDEAFHEVVRCIQKKERDDYRESIKKTGTAKDDTAATTTSSSNTTQTTSRNSQLICCLKTPTND